MISHPPGHFSNQDQTSPLSNKMPVGGLLSSKIEDAGRYVTLQKKIISKPQAFLTDKQR
jgi:hypothetical protein